VCTSARTPPEVAELIHARSYGAWPDVRGGRCYKHGAPHGALRPAVLKDVCKEQTLPSAVEAISCFAEVSSPVPFLLRTSLPLLRGTAERRISGGSKSMVFSSQMVLRTWHSPPRLDVMQAINAGAADGLFPAVESKALAAFALADPVSEVAFGRSVSIRPAANSTAVVCSSDSLLEVSAVVTPWVRPASAMPRIRIAHMTSTMENPELRRSHSFACQLDDMHASRDRINAEG